MPNDRIRSPALIRISELSRRKTEHMMAHVGCRDVVEARRWAKELGDIEEALVSAWNERRAEIAARAKLREGTPDSSRLT